MAGQRGFPTPVLDTNSLVPLKDQNEKPNLLIEVTNVENSCWHLSIPKLAVLATYVGDEFLALYHCIRSLAVREPFPDAWNNLILLFERNRSYHLHSLCSEAHFDFLNPSESTVQTNSQSTNDASNCKMVQARDEGSGEHIYGLFSLEQ
ncbi:hypothetical protein GH714_002465 [Hevea brasiliensis]|uniref:DNA/RNA-binding domain-containing protein n=1 Tax=Hevea brasiliensis TaxID=3981 RepID=A0A6A6LCI2_HEVBR|nr:hypothetical protein GH714_002465 [Hevea brasiliensis]